MTPQYMSEAWFALLRSRVDAEGATQSAIAKTLGISGGALSQVLHGTGAYGTGAASTERIADRVIHTFGRYPCPHLSAEAGEEQVITADQCRSHAHRAVPSTPRDVKHWQACRSCQHLASSAPPLPRAAQRRVIPIQTEETKHV
ncbi:hypothetical protein [Ottowia sp. VDI28]|uniref:hypothetical protein n=1 Tax=Ottowia sp. VDI28 TaxID=3133968 RepID=UPI003C306D12